MAEQILAKLVNQSQVGSQVSIRSAGLSAQDGAAMSGGSFVALLRRGIGQGEQHAAKRVTEEQVRTADLVLTMTESHKHALMEAFPAFKGKVFTLLEYTGAQGMKDIEDPFGQDDEGYERTAKQIEAACHRIVQQLELRFPLS